MNADQSDLEQSRIRKHVAKRCHSENVTCFRNTFKQTVSGRQIRWKKEASDKPETSKLLFIPHQHFKMEVLNLTKDLFQEGDYMCNIDLRDAYFTITINQKYRKYLRFKWEGTLYKFLSFASE